MKRESVYDLSGFAGVDAWVFDLDNTLSPRHTNLFDQVDRRIRHGDLKFVARTEDAYIYENPGTLPRAM